MSIRRLLVALVLVVSAPAIALAGPPVTIVLTNGQRYNGTLLSRDNKIGLVLPNGQELSFTQTEVAAVQFEQAQPNQAQLSALAATIRTSGGNPAVALKDGKIVAGKVNSISPDGESITLTSARGKQTYKAGDIAYVYFNPQTAQTLFTPDATPPSQAERGVTGTSGQTPAQLTLLGSTRVEGRQPWTPTSLAVHQGDQLVFAVSGEVSWAQGQNPAGAAGSPIDPSVASRYPVSTLGVGALIGRVGNGAPFAIGASNQPIAMPADGQLYLGINDDYTSDNGGAFVVQVSRVGK